MFIFKSKLEKHFETAETILKFSPKLLNDYNYRLDRNDFLINMSLKKEFKSVKANTYVSAMNYLFNREILKINEKGYVFKP